MKIPSTLFALSLVVPAFAKTQPTFVCKSLKNGITYTASTRHGEIKGVDKHGTVVGDLDGLRSRTAFLAGFQTTMFSDRDNEIVFAVFEGRGLIGAEYGNDKSLRCTKHRAIDQIVPQDFRLVSVAVGAYPRSLTH